MASEAKNAYVLWWSDVGLGDVDKVGGKNASLGEMYRELTPKGIRVPNGFALTIDAYRRHIDSNGLREPISRLLSEIRVENVGGLGERARKAREMIARAPLPKDIEEALLSSYNQLSQGSNRLEVAVRSSANAEDLPEASFAGQQETFLNVHGQSALIEAVKNCFASLFTDRAIVYRHNIGFDHFKAGLSVGIQKMVRSDLASAGVMFSLDTETGFRDVVLINASYGLGETVVQGSVNPDEYYVFKPTLLRGYRPILQKRIGTKDHKLIYDDAPGASVRTEPVPTNDRARSALNDSEILQLAEWAIAIEDHYSKKHGHSVPMDIEWAKDGRTGELNIVQARPETVQARRNPNVFETYRLEKRGEVLTEGHSVGSKIARGRARVISDVKNLDQLQTGEVLVAPSTDPDWEPVMKRAAAVVTDRGGRTCHAAIVSRELGLPAVVGTENATSVVRDGQEITVSCAEGDTGYVYRGSLEFNVNTTDVSSLPHPKTQIMMNIADPSSALGLSLLPNDGVGLARMEFLINHHVKIHPMALVRFDQLQSSSEKSEIAAITSDFEIKSDYFVERLSEGISLIAAAFHPKPVILRFSDFKTNEYANLLGGREFEPHEENPMLGFRGASRYYDPRYRDGFALECRAVQRVRQVMGLKNLKVMIPFCRTVEEGERVLKEMAANGLKRGEDGLEVYVMCEIPSNVILANDFAEIFDGFSIGSNDLTQLVLGVDRDSEIVSSLFSENNPAVKAMISQVIRTAKSRGAKIGLCGQAPSDDPSFAAYLIREGIDSISLNPDAVLKTMRTVLDAERRLEQGDFEDPRARH